MARKGLNSKEILDRIRKNKEKIKEKGVRKIGLFGSYLSGKQKRGSDVDILVEFNKIDVDDYFGAWFLLEKLFKRKVDLIIEGDLRPELSYVKKEAKYVKI